MRRDVHAHYFPTVYLDLLQRFGSRTTDVARGLGAGSEQPELATRLALMDSAEVQMQVLSVSPQLPYFEKKEHAVEAARMINDIYADLLQRYPTRFTAFAALPLPHVDASLEELARALAIPGMVGVTMATSVLGRSLIDPLFEPVYAELNRRGTILCTHPAGADACSPLIAQYGLTWPIGAPIEDTIAVTHLILKGIPAHYPRLKIIIPHLGGALPMLLQRLDNQAGWFMPGSLEAPAVTAKRLWYDTVGHFHVPALQCAYQSVGADRLVLGTDFPYLSGDWYRRSVNYITEAGLSDEEAQAILEQNATRLFQ